MRREGENVESEDQEPGSWTKLSVNFRYQESVWSVMMSVEEVQLGETVFARSHNFENARLSNRDFTIIARLGKRDLNTFARLGYYCH